jgi:hypothetical protein
MTTWKPTDDQTNFLITPAWEAIRDELVDLQSELGCPDSYIAGLVENVAARWLEAAR